MRSLISIALMSIFCSCATVNEPIQGQQQSPLDGAQKNYSAGIQALSDQRYAHAIQYFEYVKSNFPYSSFAELSDLKIAEAYFAQDKWVQAAYAFNYFTQFHPNSKQLDYAAYKEVLSFYKAKPTELFFLPSNAEKDQSAYKDAARAATSFKARFPKSKHLNEVRKLLGECSQALVSHDLEVIRFYKKRGKFRGALWRYEKILQEHPSNPNTPALLLEASKLALEKLNDKATASKLLTRLATDYPKHLEATPQARELLAEVR